MVFLQRELEYHQQDAYHSLRTVGKGGKLVKSTDSETITVNQSAVWSELFAEIPGGL